MTIAQYEVTIYYVHELLGAEGSDKASLPLTILVSEVIEAEGEKLAAAKLWFENIGIHRMKKLEELNAPKHIRDKEDSPEAVANLLVESSLCPEGGYLLDYVVEAWLIGVSKIQSDS